MDADIKVFIKLKQRWRTMGATRTFHFPNEKVALVPSKHDRATKTPISKLDKSRLIPKQQPESLKSLFDRFAISQKKDIIDYTFGHMNPAKAIQHFQKTRRQKEPILFGKTKTNPGERPDIEDMVSILQKYDPVGSEKTVQTPIEETRLKPKPKKQTLLKRIIPDAHLSFTKQQNFKIMSKIDTNLIKPGRDLRHTDHGKLSLLSKIESFLSRELEANNCPATGPHPQRLEIFGQCFDMIISEFTTFGPILSAIKVSKQN
jgi:hypothetical protein